MASNDHYQLTELTPVTLQNAAEELTDVKVPYACKTEDPNPVADPDENTYIDDAADRWLRQLQSLFRGLPKEMFVN